MGLGSDPDATDRGRFWPHSQPNKFLGAVMNHGRTRSVFAWYCVRLNPGQTATAVGEILKLDFRILNPTFIARKVIRHLVREVERPLFPGYLFTEFDVESDPWQRINRLRGVRRLITDHLAEEPTPIPQRVMDDLLRRTAGGPIRDFGELVMFHKGQSLRIIDGPLEGQIGTCEWSERDRVKVLLSLFARPTTVELRAKAVEVWNG